MAPFPSLASLMLKSISWTISSISLLYSSMTLLTAPTFPVACSLRLMRLPELFISSSDTSASLFLTASDTVRSPTCLRIFLFFTSALTLLFLLRDSAMVCGTASVVKTNGKLPS